VQSIFKEALNLKRLRHKNIIELYHAFVEKKQLIMIMEFAGGGELLGYLQKKNALDEMETRQIIMQVANSINYCHTRGIVHRDLKLENVIFKNPMDSDGKQDLFVKVIDFGIAGVCENGRSDKMDAGSLCYMSPECLMGKAVEASPSIDVWAIGVMFYSLLQGTLPFYADDEDTTIKLIKTAPIKWAKDIPVTAETKEIILKMLDRDPNTRLDLMDLIEMDYFRYDDETFAAKVAETIAEQERRREEEKSNLDLPQQKQQSGASPRGKPGAKKPVAMPAVGKGPTPKNKKAPITKM
jgi:serine/threonine protein kinase